MGDDRQRERRRGSSSLTPLILESAEGEWSKQRITPRKADKETSKGKERLTRQPVGFLWCIVMPVIALFIIIRVIPVLVVPADVVYELLI